MIRESTYRSVVKKAKAINYFRNLDSCVLDAQNAAHDSNAGPNDITNFSELQVRLDACQLKYPSLYREKVIKPYVDALNLLGEIEFDQIIFARALPSAPSSPPAYLRKYRRRSSALPRT